MKPGSRSNKPRRDARTSRSISTSSEDRLQAGFDAAHSKGLFVGVRSFDDDRLVEVPFAVDDAVDLAFLFSAELQLVKPSGLTLCLSGEPQKKESAERLQKLLDDGAEKKAGNQTEIYRSLDRAAGEVGPDGILLSSVATHGFSVEGEDYLVASNSMVKWIEQTGVKAGHFIDEMSLAGTRRRVLLIDACRERLIRGRRGRSDPDSGMGMKFQEAINHASGLVVFSAATLGGYAYDDDALKNGVFSAAIMEGLRGKAPADSRGFITVRTLADFVHRHVRQWIQRNRRGDEDKSRGITCKLDFEAASFPLSVHPAARKAFREYQSRCEAALRKARDSIGGRLTGAMYDEIKLALSARESRDEAMRKLVEELLEEVEALDGSSRSRRRLVDFFAPRRSRFPVIPETPEIPPSADHAPAVKKEAELSPGEAAGLLLSLSDTVSLEFVQIEPGSFKMGSEKHDDEKPVRRVQISRGFQLGKHEVTQAQWEAVMGERKNRSGFRGPERPVENVSWDDVQEFLKKLNARGDGWRYRLPTEAEWEYAARAGTKGDFAGDLDEMAWYEDNSGDQTHPVGKKKPNAWGLYDMHGNVWEWVQDSYDGNHYASRPDPDRDPQGPEKGFSRVLRGGGWNVPADYCRSADRRGWGPDFRSGGLGFRLLRHPE